MDYIERCFHISPDGGNGFFEAFLVGTVMASIAFVFFIRYYFVRFKITQKIRLAGEKHQDI